MMVEIKIFYFVDDNFRTDVIISFQNAHIYNNYTPKIIHHLHLLW